jgi:hypothetical protein
LGLEGFRACPLPGGRSSGPTAKAGSLSASSPFHSLLGANGEKVFEAHAESRTPGAYRVFWHYGPGKGELTIIAITPHP